MNITDIKENLSSQLHGNTLNRVRNIEYLFERSANILLSRIDPIDTVRTAALAQTIHDDIYDYPLPSDYKKIIDLYPQADRESDDTAGRRLAENFDVQKGIKEKTLSIEGSEGSKTLRVNWRTRQGKTLHNMNSVTSNGTWTAVGTASGIVADDIDYVSGSASIQFDILATGDGIQNIAMSAVDMTDEDETADIFVWVKIKNTADLAKVTSITCIWGNDVTTAYWTGVAQTAQADGTAFKVGWNLIKVPWSTATETGTVAPATIDSFKLTVAATGAITNIRVDNIIFSIGKNFDIKYYSKYLLKNTAGTWISRTTSGDDTVVLDNDAIEIFHLQNLILAAQQLEGADSLFDINWAQAEMERLIKRYKAEYPSMSKIPSGNYGSFPDRHRFSRW